MLIWSFDSGTLHLQQWEDKLKCSQLVPWVDGIGDSPTDDGSCENREFVPPGCTLDSSRNVNVALEEQTLGEGEKNTSKLPLLPPMQYPSWVLTAHWGVSAAVSSVKPCVISKGHTDCPDYGNSKPSEIWSYVLASLLSYVIFEDKPGFAVNCKDAGTSHCFWPLQNPNYIV